MKERLQKIMSAYGVASRRSAEKMISDGRVSVNGEVAELGMSADSEKDIITVDGIPLGPAPEHKYIMLHKPRGYVTTMADERGRSKTVDTLVRCGVRVYPAGRLDMASEGLLIMTNDGDAALALTHPRRQVDKTYRVTVEPATDEKIVALSKMNELDGEKIVPPGVEVLARNGVRWRIEMVIHEGKNRQIRRMCEAQGMEVRRLKRVRIGDLKLGMLAPGEWRELTEDEIKYLKTLR